MCHIIEKSNKTFPQYYSIKILKCARYENCFIGKTFLNITLLKFSDVLDMKMVLLRRVICTYGAMHEYDNIRASYDYDTIL